MDGGSLNRVRLGKFELDLRAGELRKDNRKILLQEQPFQILLMLVERHGDLLDREVIRKRLWPNDTIVEFDHSIHTAIKKLRQALGDSADNPQYVETVARRGYRLLVPVEHCLDEPAPDPVVVQAEETKLRSESASLDREIGSGAALVGKRVSHYRVLGVLGGGGMGLIYWAEDIKLGRSVALKFLPEELANDPVALERFEREARAMSALDHPNICAVHEFGEQEGRHFIVMPLLEGKTLRDRISSAEKKNSPFSTQDMVTLGLQIAEGLGAAHRQGIIHRDIKPSNIFITDSGIVKILDFGLAKRAAGPEQPDEDPKGGSAGTIPPSINSTLTRTGIRLGTAAYMSPEQVRGEPLDARSDLFSFGLVLYEMATGRQAFEGATAAVVNDAILHRSPVPVHQLNPGISQQLVSVINKALEKDRQQRYQSAAEIRQELLQLEKKGKPLRWVVAGAGALGILTLGVLWPRHTQPTSLPEIRQTQLTASSSDLPVSDGCISPDGKYLAYSDGKGIHLKHLATGEIETFSQEFSVAYFAWFPDSARFLASQVFRPGIWEYSITGGPPRQFLDHGTVSGVSPDSSLVSYTANIGHVGEREIWLIGSDGKNPRLFLSVDEDTALQEPYWTPDGRRISYQWQRQTADGLQFTVETRDLQGGSRVVLYSETAQTTERIKLQDLVWLPGERLILSLDESDSAQEQSAGGHCNLWELHVDPDSGQATGPMRRLTNWPRGSALTALYATSDGKKISVFRMGGSVSIFLADLSESKYVSAPRPFSNTEGWNSSPAWTLDSQEIIYESNRDGSLRLFRQHISSDTAQPVLLDSREASLPAVSPDGAYLLFLDSAHDSKGGPGAPVKIMRAPLNGGASQLVLSARIYDLPRCSRAPATLCAIAEPSEDRRGIIFTAFDPVQGRGRELARFDADPKADYTWALSPSGEQIALLKRVPGLDGKIFAAEGPIHVLSLNGQPPREVHVKGRDYFHEYVDWAPDGKGLLLTGRPGDNEVLRVDLEGNVTVLSREKGIYTFRAVPSPDGRHLAMLHRTVSNNVWLLENF
jgi:serine/threonine protein kinase/DNA-binding winged helix-turn-helix (wHTH) protein